MSRTGTKGPGSFPTSPCSGLSCRPPVSPVRLRLPHPPQVRRGAHQAVAVSREAPVAVGSPAAEAVEVVEAAGELPRQRRQHVTTEHVYPLALVAADIVQVDAVEAEVEVLLDVGAVQVGVG